MNGPEAVTYIIKVAQHMSQARGVGKEGCLKTAAYLGHIAAKLAPTTQTLRGALSTATPKGMAALKAVPSMEKLPTSALGLETLRKTSSVRLFALFDELQKIALATQAATLLGRQGVGGAAHLIGGKGETIAKALGGLKPRAGATPLATAQREIGGFKSLAGGGPPGGTGGAGQSGMFKGWSMEKEEGLFGKMFGSGASKVAPRIVGGGAGGASALRAAERGGWGTVGVNPSGYVGGAARAKPIGSLQQNIAERGISL